MKTQFTPTTPRDPVAEMIEVLKEAGRYRDTDANGDWVKSLCALVLALEPHCRTYRLLEALPYHRNISDSIDVLNTLAHLGYFSRAIRDGIDTIDSRLLPCLYIDHTGAPAVLIEKGDDNVRLYAGGKLETMPLSALRMNAGTFWLFRPYDENKASTSKFMRGGSGHSWFRAVLGRFKGAFAQILTAGLVINLIALTTPLFIILIYSRVIASGTVGTLPMLAAGMGLAIIVEFMFRRIRSHALSWLAARMDNIVGNRIFSHLIGLSPELIERASVAAQIARIKTFESVRDFFSGSVFLSMMEIPYVVLSLAAIYFVAGQLVLVPVVMALAYVGLFYAAHRRVKVVIRLAAKASSARQQFTIETFEKLSAIRGFGLSRIWEQKFRALSGQEMKAHFHLNWIGMAAETVANALTILSAVLTIGFGVSLIWAGHIGTGALVATMILVWRVLTPFYSMCTMIPRLEQLRNSIIQVNNLMDIDTEAMQAQGMAQLPRMRGQISFNHVTFRYNEKLDPVFQNLNLDARAGDLVAVTGENGAGKTTVLKLIKNLYHVTEGSLQIDGFDTRQLSSTALRRQIAYLPQQSEFFHGTLLENLRTGNPLANEEDIRLALDYADALEEAECFPGKLTTVIGKYGDISPTTTFMNKLALARVYLHPAPIVLLDELPNTILGGRAGRNLKEYLVNGKGTRTCFFITYRDDFMKLADTVVALRRGESPIVGSYQHVVDNYMEAA